MTLITWYEIVAKKILPAIRCVVAEILIKEYGLTQVKAAELLGVSQPAISHYISSRRGGRGATALKNDPEIYALVKDVAKYLVEDNRVKLMKTIDEILRRIREKPKLYREIVGEEPKPEIMYMDKK